MSNENPRRQPLWTGASLFTVSATSLLLMIAAIVPAEESAANASHNWFTASLVITLVAVALAASIVGWSLNSSGRPAIGVRIYFVAEVLLLAAAGVALAQRSAWHDAAPDMPVVFFVPFVLIGLAACGAPSVLSGLRTIRRTLAEHRAADTSTIEGYLLRLNARLRTTPASRRRIMHEAEDHLRSAAVAVGEAKAIERFGTPERLADAFADESYQARVRTVAWANLLAVSFGLAVLMYEARRVFYGAVASLNQIGAVWWTGSSRYPRIEPVNSWLTLVLPPFRGGLAIALAVASLSPVAAALLAVAAARRRPSLALKATLLSLIEGVAGFSLALVLWKRLSEGSWLTGGSYPSIPQHSIWAAIAVGAAFAAACWCAVELAPWRRPGLGSTAALCALIVLPLGVGFVWKAPQPPSDGRLGLPPQAWLTTSLTTYGRESAAGPLEESAGKERLSIAWLGWADERPGQLMPGKTRAPELAGYTFFGGRSRSKPHEPIPFELPLKIKDSVRALAVTPEVRPTAAWGSNHGLWLRTNSGRVLRLTNAPTAALQLLETGNGAVLYGISGGALVVARSPLWRPRRLETVKGDLLSAAVTARGVAVLIGSGSGLRLDLRTPNGSLLGSWRVAEATNGVAGRLADGRPAVAFNGLVSGSHVLAFATLSPGGLKTQVVSNEYPCAVPVAVGSIGRSPALLTRSRCLRPKTAAGDPGGEVLSTFEFLEQSSGWDRYVFPGWVFQVGAYVEGSPVGATAGLDHSVVVAGDGSAVFPG